MERYESMGVVGEGSYGVVLKCRHRDTGQIVAVKKFLESDEDPNVKKIALREVRMLKKVRHENLVNLIEFFRRKRRLYLVFEYVDHTVLDELESAESGLDPNTARSHIFQVIRGVAFCHDNQIIHRDVKPENVLVSQLGVVKLCDFGFARVLEGPNESCTDYVATRWYRAPELLVGDTKYGREVDIWAIGCLLAEILSGEPLFPGESDIDQLFQIIQTLGELSSFHQNLVSKNPMLSGLRLPNAASTPLSMTFPKWTSRTMLFISKCLDLTPGKRPSADELLKHEYFIHDSFPETFIPQLRKKVQQEFSCNLLVQYSNTRKGSGQNEKKSKKGKNETSDTIAAKAAPKPFQPLTARFLSQKQPNPSSSSNLYTSMNFSSTNFTSSNAQNPISSFPSTSQLSTSQHSFSSQHSSNIPTTSSYQSSSTNQTTSAVHHSSINNFILTNLNSPSTQQVSGTYSSSNLHSSTNQIPVSHHTQAYQDTFTNPSLIPSHIHSQNQVHTPSNQSHTQSHSHLSLNLNNDQSLAQTTNTQTTPSQTPSSKPFITYTALTASSNGSRINIFPFDDGPTSLPFSHIPPLKDTGSSNISGNGNGNSSGIFGSSSFAKTAGSSAAINLHMVSSPKYRIRKEEKTRKSPQTFLNSSTNLKNQNLLIKGQNQFQSQIPVAIDSSYPVGSSFKDNGNSFAIPSSDNSLATDPISLFSRHHQFDYTRHPYAISLDRTKDLSARDSNRDPLKEIKDNGKDSKRNTYTPHEVKDGRKSRKETTGRTKLKHLNDDLYLPHLLTVTGKPNSPKKSTLKDRGSVEGISEVSQTKIKKGDYAMPFLGGLDRGSASSIDSSETIRPGSNFPYV